MASAVSPRSKLNIRYALGIMGCLRTNHAAFSCAQPYALQMSLSRAKGAEKGARRANGANSPWLWRAQRAVIHPNNARPESQPGAADNQGAEPCMGRAIS